MFSTLALTVPIAMPSSTSGASSIGSGLMSWSVGLSIGPQLVPATVARAAPATSSSAHGMNTPRVADQNTDLVSERAGRYREKSSANGAQPSPYEHEMKNARMNAPSGPPNGTGALSLKPWA